MGDFKEFKITWNLPKFSRYGNVSEGKQKIKLKTLNVMTFREFMAENNYELLTTFWDDFSIADRFGVSAVRDTFNRAFAEWKEDYQYLTELILVLNHKIWQHYEKRPELVALYQSFWEQADRYAVEHLQGDELSYYYRVTD